MRICELTAVMPEHILPPEVNRDIELIPTVDPAEIKENSLLYIYKRINGGYNIDFDKIERLPYAIVSDIDLVCDIKIPIIRTEKVRKSLSYAFYIESGFDKSKTKLIAVTGTNGKTSTSTIIHNVLNGLGVKCGQIGTGILRSGSTTLSDENYNMTTPDADMLFMKMREMQRMGCEVIVMEVSSHSIAFDKITPLFFDIALFTNLSSEHLDFHRDMESYYLTKLKLFDHCQKGVFNIDDDYGKRAYTESGCDKLSFGILERGEIYCTDIEYHGLSGTDFYYCDDKRIFKISTPLPGCFNIYNCALAMSAILELGIPASKAKAEISTVSSISGRMEIVHERPTVIIDYAHTPLAMDNVLQTLHSQLKSRQRLIIIFGCGGDRDKTKRAVMGKIASKYADKIYLTEDNSRSEDPKDIIADILNGIKNRENVTVIYSRKEAIIKALREAKEDDVIAIIGKGHERYIIDKEGKRDFNEPDIIKNFYEVNTNQNAN